MKANVRDQQIDHLLNWLFTYAIRDLWCVARFGTIWLACNFTKINTPPWVFFTFFKLCKWYLIAQRIILLKVTLLHGCFSRFLNCTNGTRSHKTSHNVIHLVWGLPQLSVPLQRRAVSFTKQDLCHDQPICYVSLR